MILLSNIPSGVTFAGWDLGNPDVTASLTGIHHPSGSWKRISFGTLGPDEEAVVDGSVYWGTGYSRSGVEGSGNNQLYAFSDGRRHR